MRSVLPILATAVVGLIAGVVASLFGAPPWAVFLTVYLAGNHAILTIVIRENR